MFTVAMSNMIHSNVVVGGSDVRHAIVSGVVVVRWQTSVWTSERGPRSQQRQDHEHRNLYHNQQSHPTTVANCLSCLAGETPKIDGSMDPRRWYMMVLKRATWQEDVLEISGPTLIGT